MHRPIGSTRLALLLLVLLALHAPGASAQTPPTRPSAPLPWPQDSMSSRVQQLSSGHSWISRMGTAVGGALVGAGVGFFVSQVALGDWDQGEGNRHIDRTTWAGVGGALGLTLGFSFPIGGRPGALGASGLSPSGGPGLALPGGRNRITQQEIAGTGATTAYDVVRNLRSDWMLRRQAHTWEEMSVGPDIPVYLNSQLLGGLDALSTVSAQDVRAIYRFSTSQATTRWGAGHENGAIMIVTKG